MQDLESRIRALITPKQLSVLATLTPDGRAWARYMVSFGQDDFSIIYATYSGSRKVKNIERNPRVHVTMGAKEAMEPVDYLQVVGMAEVLTDENSRHHYWQNDFTAFFSGPDDPSYAVIRVVPERIEYVSMRELNHAETEIWEA